MKKTAIVSGGTGYVGSAIVKRLEDDGMNVAVLYNSPRTPKKNEYKCDLEDGVEVRRIMDKIEREMGEIYAYVHAAGTKPDRKQLHLSSAGDLKKQFAVNVFGSFNFLSACAARVKSRGGVIVGITTEGVVDQRAVKGLGSYVPAKYALQGMLAVFRQELFSHNVRVYSVAPGFMEGGMNRDVPKAFIEMIKKKNPTSVLTTAQDVAGVVSSLCSKRDSRPDKFTISV